MSNYVTLPFNKKLNLLRAHCFDDGEWTDLDHEKWCLHCGKKFNGHSARVWTDTQGELWLECGTPDCDGSPIDWAEYPWWDEKHPATKAHLKRQKGSKPKKNLKKRKASADKPEDDVPF